MRKAALLATGLVLAAPVAQAESILVRVLNLIAASEPLRLSAVFANVAENAGSLIESRRTLMEGDSVVIGFGSDGLPVTRIAGPLGLGVDAETAASLSGGLASGIYPLGSALWRLPPAGQLALWNEDQSGHALTEARALLAGRIDGGIDLIAFAQIVEDPRLVTVAALSVSLAEPVREAVDRRVQSMVLGAVNAGTVLQGLNFRETGDIIQHQVSAVEAGSGRLVEAATSATSSALNAKITAFGAAPGITTLALNLAGNTATVDGAVHLMLRDVSARIGTLTTTVIGAVDDGTIRTTP